MQYISPSEAQTMSIARQLAAMVKGGDVVMLQGDLGAGKTTFTKGFAEELGVTDTITSPTFSIMNVYKILNSEFRIQNLIHIDTYRLKNEDELLAIGVEDYLGAANTVTVIEWPEKIPGILKKQKVISVSIEHLEGDERRITVEGIS